MTSDQCHACVLALLIIVWGTLSLFGLFGLTCSFDNNAITLPKAER